ncbi:MAG: hypothetical protein R3F51_16465 [Cyanobacteriota/Melainabacteria group bacterium]
MLYAIAYPDVVVKAIARSETTGCVDWAPFSYNLEARALFDLPVWDINGTPKIFP